ncbi:hypothetical protein HHI36_021491 [Cryptolaemus montrouzieri]|uniref:Protein takeout n=1 Tax=Cryptolaemus montrouzieri TaxID=559131 RepID=A0ABD2MWY6_9CUCU
MAIFYFSIFCFSICFGCFLAVNLPSNFKKCSRKDFVCLKDAIQDALPKLKNGIPELEVPALDPLSIPKMVIPPGGNVVQLEQIYTDSAYNGISKAKIEKLDFDIDKGKIEFQYTTPYIELNGTYEVNGRILTLPVFGKGPCSIRLNEVTGNLRFDLETFTKDSETYIRGKRSQMVIDIKQGHYKFDNLFDGNKLLGDNLNMVLNDNWRAIFDEIISGYAQAYADGMMEVMNKLFEKIPIREMFSD